MFLMFVHTVYQYPMRFCGPSRRSLAMLLPMCLCQCLRVSLPWAPQLPLWLKRTRRNNDRKPGLPGPAREGGGPRPRKRRFG